MSFVVKSTTKWRPLDLLCPHTCRGCGRLGTVLCECCKNNILAAQKAICPLCKQTIARSEKDVLQWKCLDCELPYQAIFVGGWREGVLAKLIKQYKYQSVWAAGEVLAEIMDAAIPSAFCGGAESVVVVPLPTIGRHVRERGIDHTARLGRKLARRRGWKVQRLLERRKDTVQVGAKAEERERQAAEAYQLNGKVEAERTYLLLDDVWTTGATMLAAAKVLQEAGAKCLFGAVLATGKARAENETLAGTETLLGTKTSPKS